MSEQPERDLDGYVDFERGVIDVYLGGAAGEGDAAADAFELARQLLSNALPNADPRKPKREWVEAIRRMIDCAHIMMGDRAIGDEEWDEFYRHEEMAKAAVDWLESLLPPREED